MQRQSSYMAECYTVIYTQNSVNKLTQKRVSGGSTFPDSDSSTLANSVVGILGEQEVSCQVLILLARKIGLHHQVLRETQILQLWKTDLVLLNLTKYNWNNKHLFFLKKKQLSNFEHNALSMYLV